MTEEVRLMIGIPGSGKSTWIKEEQKRLLDENKSVAIISRDWVREHMLQPGEDYFSHENEVFAEFVRQINEVIELGIDVVFVDATHISPASRRKVLSKLKPNIGTNLILEIMNIPVETAIKRNANRAGFARVPDSAIRNMARGFKLPTVAELADAKCYGFNKVYMKYHNEE